MIELKILTNQNKIISKLPVEFSLFKKTFTKNCTGIIGNQVKLKLIEPIYLDVVPEDIVQTFLYLFNNNAGKGIFINVDNGKIKTFIPFNNELKGIYDKSDLVLINQLYKMYSSVIKNSNYNLMFFINLSNYPVLFKKTFTNGKKLIPVVSFSSSYSHFDICLPLPKNIIWPNQPSDQGILFIFEKKKINTDSYSKKIYSKIIEFKKHPFYKNFKLDYITVDNLNDIKKIKLLSSIVIISDPYVPIYYQYFLNAKCSIILIENASHYTYYSKLLNPNVEYIKWSIESWEQQLDTYVENKKISNNLTKWIDQYFTLDSLKSKYLGFLEHLNQNFYTSSIIVEPFINYTEYNLNITNQLDYNKFFELLHLNYRLIRCWSYRLNPYSNLLSLLKTNHTFIPEYIKLSLTSFGSYDNLHWISSKRSHIDYLPQLLKKNNLKNVNQYIIKKSDELISLNIINNISSVFYVEIPEPSHKFNLWENDFVYDFESFMQFMHNQPDGSTFIIRIFTFHLPRTINMIQTFQTYFEKIKLIKNELFDLFLPYRYLVGIKYLKTRTHKVKSILDFETYNNLFFSTETQELIKIIKYIKSDASVDLLKFKNFDLTNEWINKWFNPLILN